MPENANVVTLDDHRPHTAGDAKCMKCKHEWVATMPSQRKIFDCPECGFESGMFHNFQVTGKAVYMCPCGNSVYEVTEDGEIGCINCGEITDLDELF